MQNTGNLTNFSARSKNCAQLSEDKSSVIVNEKKEERSVAFQNNVVGCSLHRNNASNQDIENTVLSNRMLNNPIILENNECSKSNGIEKISIIGNEGYMPLESNSNISQRGSSQRRVKDHSPLGETDNIFENKGQVDKVNSNIQLYFVRCLLAMNEILKANNKELIKFERNNTIYELASKCGEKMAEMEEFLLQLNVKLISIDESFKQIIVKVKVNHPDQAKAVYNGIFCSSILTVIFGIRAQLQKNKDQILSRIGALKQSSNNIVDVNNRDFNQFIENIKDWKLRYLEKFRLLTDPSKTLLAKIKLFDGYSSLFNINDSATDEELSGALNSVLVCEVRNMIENVFWLQFLLEELQRIENKSKTDHDIKKILVICDKCINSYNDDNSKVLYNLKIIQKSLLKLLVTNKKERLLLPDQQNLKEQKKQDTEVVGEFTIPMVDSSLMDSFEVSEENSCDEIERETNELMEVFRQFVESDRKEKLDRKMAQQKVKFNLENTTSMQQTSFQNEPPVIKLSTKQKSLAHALLSENPPHLEILGSKVESLIKKLRGRVVGITGSKFSIFWGNSDKHIATYEITHGDGNPGCLTCYNAEIVGAAIRLGSRLGIFAKESIDE